MRARNGWRRQLGGSISQTYFGRGVSAWTSRYFERTTSFPCYEAGPCDEVPAEVAFMGQKAETRNQAENVYIIPCVGAAGKVLMEELDGRAT